MYDRNIPMASQSIWTQDIQSILYSKEQITARVKEIGMQISKDFEGKNLVCIGLLNGAFVFMADLVRELTVATQIDFMSASSYGASSTSSGQVRIRKDVTLDLTNRHVLVIEDIIDTGNTLNLLKEYLGTKGCASISLCCLLDKISCRQVAVDVRYVGFVTSNDFLVGYGLDYAEAYRSLPYIGILKPEVYKK